MNANRSARVGLLILNYHQHEATLNCIRSLLEVEGPEARVLWIENDAAATGAALDAALEGSGLSWVKLDPAVDALPEPGQIGVILLSQNLGYAAGNNAGLRFLHRHGVEFAWVLNNDTLLTRGSSRDLVEAVSRRPEVGLWGMWVHDIDQPAYIGCRIQPKDFAVGRIQDPARLEADPMAFINGCAMFMRVGQALELGGIPEEYFMYYEDQAFTWEYRRRGWPIGTVDSVDVLHLQSLSTGHRSRFTEYYCRRNRWYFIQKYFPEALGRQKLLFYTYQMQKLFFRLRFDRIRLEWAAHHDFRNGRLGRSTRKL